MPESGEISESKGVWWALQIWQAPQGGGLEGIQGEEEAWPEAEGVGGMTLWSGLRSGVGLCSLPELGSYPVGLGRLLHDPSQDSGVSDRPHGPPSRELPNPTGTLAVSRRVCQLQGGFGTQTGSTLAQNDYCPRRW